MTIKSILIFLSGIVTGIILTFVFFFFVSLNRTNNNQYDNTVLFDKPQQEIKVKSFEILQVFSDGSALATVEDRSNSGMVVMFRAEKGETYYDDQKINVPKGKKVMQIGTYKYISRDKMEKTVPIVEFMDK